MLFPISTALQIQLYVIVEDSGIEPRSVRKFRTGRAAKI